MSRRGNNPRRARLAVNPLDDRITPAAVSSAAPYAVGVADGQTGAAVVYNADGTEKFAVTPYGAAFTGGVRVAMADVNHDGTPDLVTAPGAGTAPTVNVYDGTTGTLIDSFDAYESTFTGGVTVAAADLSGDGSAEIVTGADQGGGPRVRVFDGASVAAGSTGPTTLDDFLAINDPNFRGGVRIALGDINGDGTADLLVGAGYGGGPRVAGFDGASLGTGTQVKLFADFFAYEPGLRNGINVGVGDVNGDGKGDLVFGGGPGGGPRVRVADGAGVLAGGGGGSLDDMPAGLQLANFFAGDPNSRDGVRVGTTTGADGSAEIVGLDVASHHLGLFGPDGRSEGQLPVGGGAGFFACPGDGAGMGGPGGVGGSLGTSTQPATHFLLEVGPQAYAGSPAPVTVVALDAANHRVVNYTGTVSLTSTDANAALPADYTFTAADHGAHTLAVTPSATGTQTVTATDTGTGTVTGAVDLGVSAAPVVTQFAVETLSRATAGEPARVMIVALDAGGNPVPTYTGTVHFTSSDASATLPADYTFTAADRGVHAFDVTLTTTGGQTVSVADTTDGTLTGSDVLAVTDPAMPPPGGPRGF